MADFFLLKNKISGLWVILAPRRSKRPNEAEKHLTMCPFCPRGRAEAQEVFKIEHTENNDSARGNKVDWQVLVVTNAFPFASIHEVVIHSPDHLKSFAELSIEEVDAIFQAYQYRYNEHSHKGQVIIFHNHGLIAGESLPHPHTQIALLPERVQVAAPILRSVATKNEKYSLQTDLFTIITPEVSQWPDEVWIAPKAQGKTFGQISGDERKELAYLVKQLVLIYDHRYEKDFPYNFYIYPGENWYLRIIPRIKSIGGFELATGVFVNTQLPEETMTFIKEHLHTPDFEKIREFHTASYHKAV